MTTFWDNTKTQTIIYVTFFSFNVSKEPQYNNYNQCKRFHLLALQVIPAYI